MTKINFVDAKRLRRQIEEKREDLERDQATLKHAEGLCAHKWEKIQYVPVHHNGYRIPSDRERGLVMGVDSRPEFYVSSKTVKTWHRTCAVCGKIEITDRIKKVLTSGSVEGCTGEAEVPDFGDK
jgi:hypothetical protein